MTAIVRLLVILALLPTFSACVSRGTYPQSGYLGSTEGMTDSQRDEKFEQEWVSEDTQQRVALRAFRKIQIRPLDLGHLAEADEHDPKDLEKLKRSYQSAFEEVLGERHEIVPAGQPAGPDVLVVESTLTRIYQPNRLLNLATTIIVGPITNGGAAFEARLREGQGGGDLAKIAEEQKGSWHLGSLLIGGYLKYYDTEKVFLAWAKRLDAWLSEEEPEA